MDAVLKALSSLETFSLEEQQRNVFNDCISASNGKFDEFVINIPKTSKTMLLNIWRLISKFDGDGDVLFRNGKLLDILAATKEYSDPSVQEASLSYFMSVLLFQLNSADIRLHQSEIVLVVASYVIAVIATENISLAEKAAQFVELLCKRDVSDMLIPAIFNEAQKYREMPVIRLRYQVLLAKIAGNGVGDAFNACLSCGAVDDIVSAARNSDDILSQINVIELLADLSTSRAGMDFMCFQGVISWLIDVIAGKVEMSGFIEETALRTLSDIFRKASVHTSNILSKIGDMASKQFISTLQNYLEEGDETRRILAVGILSDFTCISNESFELLFANNQGLLDAWMSLLHRGGKPEMAAAVLHSIARVLAQPDEVFCGYSSNGTTPSVNTPAAAVAAAVGEGTTEKTAGFCSTAPSSSSSSSASAAVFATAADVTAAVAASSLPPAPPTPTAAERSVSMTRTVVLKQHLWNALGRGKSVSTIILMLRMAKQPVPSVRHAAMDVLTALASQQHSTWGLHTLFPSNSIALPIHEQADTFYEYIQNRLTEFDREGKDWKFSIIVALSKSSGRDMLSAEVNATIDKLIKQGPYYMPARMEAPFTLDQGTS